VLVLAALLTVGAAPSAPADDDLPATVGAALTELAEDINALTDRIEQRMLAGWDTAVAAAVDLSSLDRLERALAGLRVEAAGVLEPLIGPHSTGQVPAAITATLVTGDMGYLDRRALGDLLTVWDRFRSAVDRALALRDRLRDRLDLPAVTGLRVCPLEHVDNLAEDWGDPRSWWRIHRGNDINAPEGTRLVAMERGTVIQMGWHWLGGNGLYVLGSVTGDVYYYAHLSAYAEGIEVGAPVEAGQVVAYVGRTGNADIPHLHLGWMPGAGAVDLDGLQDAYPMLVELCL
jgi:hypothetical protein